jgi:hypothetical protein
MRLGFLTLRAWQHINVHGRYEFCNGPEAINFNEIVRELAQFSVWQVMTGYV